MTDESAVQAAGSSGESAEAPETQAGGGLDPIAAALAATSVERGPVESMLKGYLAAQTRLVELQSEHLHEQRDLQLAHLRVRRWKDRLSISLQTLGVGLGVVAVVALGALVWQAHEDRGLVIQRFTAPPAFAERGVTGDTVAADVLGQLSAIVAFVREHSFSATGGVSTERVADVKIELPETGMSITETWRLLREVLGSSRTVTGSLRDDGDGRITLTARMEDGEEFTASGPAGDLPALERRVAEQLYGASDPNNLAVYLASIGRKADAFAAAARYSAQPLAREDRANSIVLWGDVSDDPARQSRYARLALAIDSGLMAAHLDVADAALALGHPAEALAHASAMLSARPEDQPPQHRGAGMEQMRGFARSTIGALTGDYGTAVQARAAYRATASERPRLLLEQAVYRALAHDPDASLALLEEAPVYGPVPAADEHLVRYHAAVARDDWAQARAEADALVTADAAALASTTDTDAAAGLSARLLRRDRPLLAIAEARTGSVAEAAARLAPTPTDCYPCVIARAAVAAAAGQRVDAERWFGVAIAQAPDLPQGYVERGRYRLAGGDRAGAWADAEASTRLGPHDANAHKLRGDVLAAQGHAREALEEYGAAVAEAPTWAALKAARTAVEAGRRGPGG